MRARTRMAIKARAYFAARNAAPVAAPVAVETLPRAGWYFVSETHPTITLWASEDETVARIRLISLQAANPYDRYTVTHIG